ncbi:MAG: hypothetical protein JWP87_3701 [Labilithrix sp.]|nr:hypothetical protein [Labilithrix sp.]
MPAVARARLVVTAAIFAIAGCGGLVEGETDRTEKRVIGTGAGEPPREPCGTAECGAIGPSDPPATAPPVALPGNPKTAFAWASSCTAMPGPTSPPRPTPTSAEQRVAHLEGMLHDMVGHWYGSATSPWMPPYPVFLAFEADGHYATRTADPAGTPVFYYGTDLDTPLKTWTLGDLTVLGAATGTIDIAFDYGMSFGLPAWKGLLHDVAMDTAGNRLALQFSRSDGYGPVVYDLWRCTQ